MFGIFSKNKELQVEELVEKDGIEHAAERYAKIIVGVLPTLEIAYQFVLEEIESASYGNQAARNFAESSGISPLEYKGSLDNSRPEVDGAGGPQQTLSEICWQLVSNGDLMVELRIKIVDKVMYHFSIGKYGHEEGS